MKLITPLLFFFVVMAASAQEGQQIPLWPKGAPGFENRRDEPEQAKDWWVRNIHNPSIVVFLPPKEKATGTAVLICPGGGHRNLVYNSEGKDPALYFNSIGVAAIVLKYRLFREENSPYTLEKDVKMDAYRGMRLVRSHAREWNIDPHRLGIMGFSAGGETVALVAYTPGDGDPNAADPVDRLNGKPDFQILVYPGPLGIPDVVPSYAPPAFMVVANDDECCSSPVLTLLERYRSAKLPVEAHFFSQGNHAFNMGTRSKLKSIQNWPQRLTDWLGDNNYLTKSEKDKP
jgi:acetyl esterase/lipase